MANEVSWRHTATGKTVYVTIRSAARQMWYTVTPELEALTVAHWADYDVALTESPADSYFYVGTWPAGLATAGWYWVDVYEQAAASPAIDDTIIGLIVGYWNGTTLSPWAADTVQIGGTAQTAGDVYGVVAHADYGNAKLVRSTTPANTLTVDASHQALALTNAVTNDAITAAAIANGAIDAATFAAGAIDAAAIATGAIDADAIADNAIDAGAIAGDAITAAKVAADVGTEIGTAVWATAARTLTAATNITSTGGTTFTQTGDSFLRLGAPAGASVSADILAIDNLVDDLETRIGSPSDLGSGATVAANLVDIEGQTDDIGVAGVGLTVLATAAELAKVPKSDSNVTWNATALASMQQEATDALNAYDPPTNAEMEARTLVAADYVVVGDTLAAVTTVGSVTGAVGSVTGAVGSVTGAVGSVTNGVTLADDAITNAKFDESTAFPLKSADTGATAVARTGADADTLETLSDQLDVVEGVVNNIQITGSPAYQAAASYTLTTGTQTSGTYASTDTSNAVYHVHTDTGGVLSLYYEYTLAADEIATSVIFKGRINGGNDSALVQAYDWTGAGAWVTLFTLAGTAGTTDTNQSPALVSKYTGTAANVGKVRVRLVNAVALTTATLYVDQCIIGKTITNRSIGYQDGAVWIDTVNGTAGTAAYVNGTADNPVLTLADAYTIAAAVGLNSYRLASGSSITLTASAANTRFQGAATIALNGQSIADALFRDAYTISGTGTGDDAEFVNCGIGTAAIEHGYFINCRFKGTLTMTAGDEYFVMSGYDASATQCGFTFAAGAELMLRDWHGGVQLNSMAAGDTAIIDGAGRVVIHASSVGGSITIRGHFAEATGAAAFILAGGTLTDTARWAEDQNVTNVTGNVTGSVGSIAAGGIAAASFAAGAIDAAAIKDGAIDAATFAAGAIDAAAIANGAIDAATFAAGAIDAAAIATGAIDADSLAADAGAEIADAVWDEAIAGHLGAGTTGASLNAAGAAGDPWLIALPGAYVAGSAGEIVGNLVTDIGALTPAVAISATTAASVSGGAIGIRTHHSLSQAITSTYAGNLNAATKIWLAVKSEKDDTDAQSVIFIEKTAGLTVLAGAAYTTVANGSLTIGGSAGAWTITVALDEAVTALLTAYADGMLWAECKALVAGTTASLWDGVCDVTHGIVQAIV